jgi:hypothetical protein
MLSLSYETTVGTLFKLDLELLAVHIEIGGSSLDIFNVYVPHISSCPSGYSPDFHALLDLLIHDALFFGDFNAYHPYWFSPRDPSDPRGDSLASSLDSSMLCSLNLDSPTITLSIITLVPLLTSLLPRPTFSLF